jgi:hypothetical protein
MPLAVDALLPPIRGVDAVITATTVETMATMIYMVSGDTRPTLEFTVKDDNGTVLSLSLATGIFRIRKVGTTAVLISRAVTITDAPNGKCQFAWLATDWNAGVLDAAGNYDGELEITFSGGGIGSVFALYTIVVRTAVG